MCVAASVGPRARCPLTHGTPPCETGCCLKTVHGADWLPGPNMPVATGPSCVLSCTRATDGGAPSPPPPRGHAATTPLFSKPRCSKIKKAKHTPKDTSQPTPPSCPKPSPPAPHPHPSPHFCEQIQDFRSPPCHHKPQRVPAARPGWEIYGSQSEACPAGSGLRRSRNASHQGLPFLPYVPL